MKSNKKTKDCVGDAMSCMQKNSKGQDQHKEECTQIGRPQKVCEKNGHTFKIILKDINDEIFIMIPELLMTQLIMLCVDFQNIEREKII